VKKSVREGEEKEDEVNEERKKREMSGLGDPPPKTRQYEHIERDVMGSKLCICGVCFCQKIAYSDDTLDHRNN